MKDLSKSEQNAKSILIVRLSAIGDVIMASQILPPLRQHYPGSRITWLVQPEARDLLTENAMVDDVIVWPRNQWIGLWKDKKWIQLSREVRKFIKFLKRQNFDVAIDIQGLFKSGVWAYLSGAPERIGLGSKEGSRFLMTRSITKPKDNKKIGSEYRFLVKEMGLDSSLCCMQIGLARQDEQFVTDFVQENDIKSGYIVACPFTTRPQKHWFNSQWLELTEQLNAKYGLPVVILGGPGDVLAAKALTKASTARIFNLTGETRLRQAAALIKSAKLLIGVDTGLTHIGTAFEIPTIALFGSTCPYLETDSNKTRVIYKNLECSPCRRKPTCNGDYTCMRLITAEEVIDTARELLPKA